MWLYFNRNALTEVCVLADVLAIAKEKRYMVLDHVPQEPLDTKPMVQVYARKKVIRLEVLRVVFIHISMFWDVTVCSLVDRQQCPRAHICCEDKCSRFWKSVGTCTKYMVFYRMRTHLKIWRFVHVWLILFIIWQVYLNCRGYVASSEVGRIIVNE